MDGAETLDRVLVKFCAWLDEFAGENYSLAADCQSDLRHFLLPECRRKKIRVRDAWRVWVDIGRHLMVHFDLRRPGNLQMKLAKVGLTFEGTPHRGIDDARNIGRLALALQERGVSLTLTTASLRRGGPPSRRRSDGGVARRRRRGGGAAGLLLWTGNGGGLPERHFGEDLPRPRWRRPCALSSVAAPRRIPCAAKKAATAAFRSPSGPACLRKASSGGVGGRGGAGDGFFGWGAAAGDAFGGGTRRNLFRRPRFGGGGGGCVTRFRGGGGGRRRR